MITKLNLKVSSEFIDRTISLLQDNCAHHSSQCLVTYEGGDTWDKGYKIETIYCNHCAKELHKTKVFLGERE